MPTYRDFRILLQCEGCEEAFDRAFYNHNVFTLLDGALWEMTETAYIVAMALILPLL